MAPQDSFNELLLQMYRKEMKPIPVVQKHIDTKMHIYTHRLSFSLCVCVCVAVLVAVTVWNQKGSRNKFRKRGVYHIPAEHESWEDIRENILNYNEEGGGEQDQVHTHTQNWYYVDFLHKNRVLHTNKSLKLN